VILELIGLFVFLIGLGGAVVVLQSRKKKKHNKPLAVLAYLILIAIGLWLASPVYGTITSTLGIAPSAETGFSQTLLENQTQVFTQRIAPLVCDEGQLVFWREFTVYSVTSGNVTKNYTTVTLFIENKGNASVSKFILKERLPEAVAQTPSELFNFTVQPYGFEKGSVVVEWLFDNVGPGETKSVSYTVEKEIDERTMGDYEAPKIFSQQTNEEVSVQPAENKQAGFDLTLVGIIGVMVVLAGAILYFMRKAQTYQP
jgi:hypothetical protein